MKFRERLGRARRRVTDMIVLAPVVVLVTFILDSAVEPFSREYPVLSTVFLFLFVVPEAAVGTLLLSSFRWRKVRRNRRYEYTRFSVYYLHEWREELRFKYITLSCFFALGSLVNLTLYHPVPFGYVLLIWFALMPIWFPICLLYA